MVDLRRQRFRELHAAGLFVLPNPWDLGSARLLAAAGFEALATTSLGFAAGQGRVDGTTTLDQLVHHTRAMAGAVEVPLNVDAEHGFTDVVTTVERVAAAGAAGISIEDWDPDAGAIDPLGVAVERVGLAADVARHHGMVLTARAENHLYGVGDLDDTIARLVAYRDAGAEVVYAPGLRSLDDIAAVVTAVGVPVNVLAMPGGPTTAELASVGVCRVSTGGALARAAYGELLRAAGELRDAGTTGYAERALTKADLDHAFGH
ncbi:MAG: 3-methyl-2-oxobutanoate hydroxymethyltransferase [Actinomycetia bacterium]|nr:3-methyl-2-oxobutanoate hydroxymethyltransferase [Actinomycetes bacterium]